MLAFVYRLVRAFKGGGMNSNAKRLMVALQIGGIGLAIYGWQADNFAGVAFGLAIAIIGGIVGRMQREDDTAGH